MSLIPPDKHTCHCLQCEEEFSSIIPFASFCPRCVTFQNMVGRTNNHDWKGAQCICDNANLDRLIRVNEAIAQYLSHIPFESDRLFVGSAAERIEEQFYRINQYLEQQLLPKEQQK